MAYMTQQYLDEIEPFLGVLDQRQRSQDKVLEPVFARQLEDIYSAPTGGGGYSYGRALKGQQQALSGLAQQRGGTDALRQAQVDLAKDAARRRYIANRAATAQDIENQRAKLAGGFTDLLMQLGGELTAPIRPGGEKHGEFKAALEQAADDLEWDAAERQARRLQRQDMRQRYRDYIQEQYGRRPTLSEWDTFRRSEGM